MRRFAAMLPLLLAPAITAAQDTPRPPRPVRIGVLVNNTPEETHRRWDPIAGYLGREVPGRTFEVVPLVYGEIDGEVRKGKLDLVLTNPSDYVGLEHDHLAMRILTLRSSCRGVACDRTGAVVVARADRREIGKLADLAGRRFAAVDERSLAGWQMAARELRRRGVDPGSGLGEVRFLGSHDAVLRAVLDGSADAGTVRSDELERADASRFRVLDPRPPDARYPLPTSTPLYPEWPLAVLHGTEEPIAREVTIALLRLSADDPAAKSAGIAGWTVPLNYRPVHELLRDLKLPPYQDLGRVSLADAIHEYRYWLLGAGVALAALIGAMVRMVRLNLSHARLSRKFESELVVRERAERALRDSEALYHSLVETLPQNIFRKGTDERFSFVNRRFANTIGHAVEEILGRTDADFFPSELAAKYRDDDQQVMRTRIPYETVEKHVTPDGQVHYVQVIKSPLLDASGEVCGIQGIFWDVTGKKRAEEELARSEERFALAVRGSNDGLWDWNIETGEIYYSPRFKELLGYRDHELPNTLDMHLDRIHPDDLERVKESIRGHLKGITPFDVEYRVQSRSGAYLWFHARGQALWDREGRATRMAGSLSDITSRKRSEEQLREQNVRLQEMARSERKAHQDLKQAQSRMVSTAKLAGLGEMVAGVAHEINNPLSFVSNNVCVLQRDLAEVTELIALYRAAEPHIASACVEGLAPIRDLWDRVDMDYTLGNLPGLLGRTRDGLRRIQQIVKDLRVFARLDESDLNEVDLNAGVESTVNIVLGHAKKKQVRVEMELRPLPPVTCYPAKINQVVMNLVSNAIDASHEGGTVSVRSWAEPSGVKLEVEDHGTGIEPEVRDRIFDPFFTTKPVGIGTGLGLSISYGIVSDHGGTIEVDSTPGRGTTFTVTLPLKAPARPNPQAAASPAALATAAEM